MNIRDYIRVLRSILQTRYLPGLRPGAEEELYSITYNKFIMYYV